jgi:muramidase (phage lysozyme)
VKLDIFEVLNNISSNNFEYLNTLTDDQLKEFRPFLIQQWLKGATTNKDYHILLTNEFCNQYIFKLSKHPKLLYKLFCVANGFNAKTYYKFRTKYEDKKPLSNLIISTIYAYSKQHTHDVINLFSKNDIIDMATQLGYNKDQVKKVKKEWA